MASLNRKHVIDFWVLSQVGAMILEWMRETNEKPLESCLQRLDSI
jgi:hypothetical protein